jgi:hypothetical protein
MAIFWREKNIAFFSKNNAKINFLHTLAVFKSNALVFSPFWDKNIFFSIIALNPETKNHIIKIINRIDRGRFLNQNSVPEL